MADLLIAKDVQIELVERVSTFRFESRGVNIFPTYSYGSISADTVVKCDLVAITDFGRVRLRNLYARMNSDYFGISRFMRIKNCRNERLLFDR